MPALQMRPLFLGRNSAHLVAVIDIGKGAAAVLLVRYFAENAGLPGDILALLLFLAGAATVIGHNFPFSYEL